MAPSVEGPFVGDGGDASAEVAFPATEEARARMTLADALKSDHERVAAGYKEARQATTMEAEAIQAYRAQAQAADEQVLALEAAGIASEQMGGYFEDLRVKLAEDDMTTEERRRWKAVELLAKNPILFMARPGTNNPAGLPGDWISGAEAIVRYLEHGAPPTQST
jgi:hypothetical protein